MPQHERLIVEAQVSPMDVDRIHTGQSAEVRFTAFKTRSTPKIQGKLVSISGDRLVNEKDDRPFYLARVEISPKGLRDLSRQKLALVPGMPAEVLIVTGDRTLFQYLFAPLANGLTRSLTED